MIIRRLRRFSGAFPVLETCAACGLFFYDMKLGILVNTDRHAEDLLGLVKASLTKGHQVIVFFMDEGVRLLTNPDVGGLCENPGVEMSYCDYTTQQIGLSKEEFCEKAVCGSQYNNATMNHDADRVIVL